MYSDIDSQIANLARYGFSFFFVYILVPRILFSDQSEDILINLVSRYIRMVFITVVLGYLLVITRLFEVIALIMILLAAIILKRAVSGNRGEGPDRRGSKALLWFFDIVDGNVKPLASISQWARGEALSAMHILRTMFGGIGASAGTAALVAVILLSGYLRFFDAVVHSAPAMSDSSVTLAWMKYLEQRILFHDGIYPQGFHIYLTFLHKFSFTDPLYILKYTGPLNSVLILLGVYFVVSRLTGRVAGIVAAFSFGLLGGVLNMEMERQVATNSQEFALVFLLPAWFFTLNYLRFKNKQDFWTAAASFAVIGLVHTLVFVFLGAGVLCLLLAGLAVRFRDTFRPALHIGLAGLAAGIISVVPAFFGLLFGKDFHGSSAEFATTVMKVSPPAISPADQIALGGIVLFFLVSALIRRLRKDFIIPLSILLLGGCFFGMYMFLGQATGSVVLASRTGLVWSLLMCVAAGAGWFALFRFIPGKKGKEIEAIIGLALVVSAAAYLKPAPVEPYKMMHDSVVDQYLRISREFTNPEWMIVSQEEGYSLVLGKGWHMMLGDFLNWYDPQGARLARVVDGREDVLLTPHVFIFKEKNVFRVDMEQMIPIIARREKEYRDFDLWISRYRSKHSNTSVYYEDKDIQVIYIHRPGTGGEKT